mmetsp:Transcript_3751/g.10629  ORF Transcript_3751/g.10629 Transcript_3751/m.10629 type:complete len:228 (+) Transcript_3751:353-1036(+)
MPKPRILALHGFRTSAQVFKSQVAIAALSRFFSDEAEVVYLDAPHPASGPAYDEVLQFFEPPFYEWWNAVEAGSGKVASSGDGEWTYQGLHASLAFVEGFMREHGPFDGLMGFSQGASVAALVALMQRNGKGFQGLPPLKFLLLFAGGRSRDPALKPLYEAAATDANARISCPVFVTVGEQDPHKAGIEAILPCCAKPTVFRHPQGHQVARLPQEEQSKLAAILRGR